MYNNYEKLDKSQWPNWDWDIWNKGASSKMPRAERIACALTPLAVFRRHICDVDGKPTYWYMVIGTVPSACLGRVWEDETWGKGYVLVGCDESVPIGMGAFLETWPEVFVEELSILRTAEQAE